MPTMEWEGARGSFLNGGELRDLPLIGEKPRLPMSPMPPSEVHSAFQNFCVAYVEIWFGDRVGVGMPHASTATAAFRRYKKRRS